MSSTTRHSLPYLAEAQAQKHVTVNESLLALDALIQPTVKSREVAAAPASPEEGDGYILPASPTGDAWEAFGEHDFVVFQDSVWRKFGPLTGQTVFVEDEGAHIVWTGAAWQGAGGGASDQLPAIGVNTAPQAENKLAVKSDAVLFSHDDVTPGSGDMRLALNKSAAVDTASLVFQSGFSGRAEFGLTGSDDFAIKVSADGVTFVDAIVIDRITGQVSFPNSPSFGETSTPAYVPSGASFAISASDNELWAQTSGVAASLLSPAGASFSGGTNGLLTTDAGEVIGAPTGLPRRSYDVANATWGYLTDKGHPTLANGMPAPHTITLPAENTVDYVVDGDLGDDANDGTPAAPFATFEPVWQACIDAGGIALSAIIRRPSSGIYDMQHFTMEGSGQHMGGDLTLYFEPGITMTWTTPAPTTTSWGVPAYGTSEGFSPFYASDGTMTVYGNGLLCQGYRDKDSAQIFGASGNGTINGYDVHGVDSGDAISGHTATDQINCYRCTFTDWVKVGYANVGGSSGYCEECVFESDQSAMEPNAAGTHQFHRCVFLGNVNFQSEASCTFTQCQIGSYTDYMNIKSGTFTDCFVNTRIYANNIAATYTRCFGKATVRLRSNHDLAFEDCVFVGPAADGTFVFPFSGDGSLGELTVTDTVLSGYSTAVTLSNSTELAKWDASGSTLTSCLFHNNTNDFDATAAGEVGDTIVSPDTATDPGLGAYSGSHDQAPYATTAGAAGFVAGDVKPTGPTHSTDDAWSYAASDLGLSDGETVQLTATDGTTTDVTVSGGQLSVPPGHWQLIHGPAA